MKTSSPPCEADKLRKHWNKVAKKIDDFFQAPSTGYYRRREEALIKRFFGKLKGKKLLKLDLWNEVNNTRILFWAAQQGAKAYGLDISDYLVKKARQNLKKEGIKAKLIVCDARNVKFSDNTFDFAYTMGTIEHIPDPEVVVKEIYRILKPGGRCIVGVPNKLDPFLRPALVWLLEIFGKYLYSPEKAFSKSQLRKLLKNAGFKIVGESGILFMPGSLRIADLVFNKYAPSLCFLTNLLIKPFELLERRFEVLHRNGYLIACAAEKPKK